MTLLRAYIALYEEETPTFYHWALVIAREEGQPDFKRPIDLYQVVYSPGDEQWHTLHREDFVIQVSTDAYDTHFFALVALPSLDVPSAEEVREFIRSQSPHQGDTPLVVDGRPLWSCAQWLTRTLQRMSAKGWLVEDPPGVHDMNAFYHHVRFGTAVKCAAHLQQFDSAGNAGQPYSGTTFGNVRVLPLLTDESYQ